MSGAISSFVSVSREVRTTNRLATDNQWSPYSDPREVVASGDEDSIVIVPFTTAITQKLSPGAGLRPAEYRLWLRFASTAASGVYTGTLTLNVHGRTAAVPLELTVWPVRLPDARPFDFYGYGDMVTYARGEAVTARSTADLTVQVEAYTGAGGNVLNFVSGSLYGIRPYIKWGPSKQSLPVTTSLDALPELDFSYYDQWFDLARQKVKRIETYVNLIPATKSDVADPLVGEGRVAAGSADEKRVLRWWLEQFRAYLLQKGFTASDGFYCKISDEIGPEHIAAYRETAEVVRQAGWRPYTTVFGPISRSSEMLNDLAPYIEEWQVSWGSRDVFRRLTSDRFRLEWKEIGHPGGWQQYTNGGALDTWYHSAIYGTDANGQAKTPQVDRTLVLQGTEGGVPLRTRPNQSPWANRELNAAYILGSNVYAARADGLGPAGTTLTVRYNQQASGGSRLWQEPALTYQGQYTNAGAQDTGLWTMGTFNYDTAAPTLDRFLVLQRLSAAGAPLTYAGPYPWGNRQRGVFYRVGNTLYVSLTDGRAPGNLLTLRYSRLDANGNRVWTDAPLTDLYGQYTNGGARETWGFAMPAAATASDVEQLLVLQNVSAAGLPLEQRVTSPWGNTELGVAFVHGQDLWVATRDGRSPSASPITVRYKERIPDAVNGTVLASRTPGDKLWFYSGYGNTFAMPYELMAENPLMAAIEKPDGYAVFAFVWWNQHRVVWTDGDAVKLSTGPAYAGLRDGWRDALLIDYAVRTRGVITMGEVASTSPTSLLQLAVQPSDDPSETYTDFANLNQQTLNHARRTLLQRLAP